MSSVVRNKNRFVGCAIVCVHAQPIEIYIFSEEKKMNITHFKHDKYVKPNVRRSPANARRQNGEAEHKHPPTDIDTFNKLI